MPDNELSKVTASFETAKEKYVQNTQATPAPANQSSGEPAYYNYHIFVQGISHAIDPYECTGIGSNIEFAQAAYSPLVMKYQSSYYYSVQLFNWHKKALTGNVERRNVTIMFLDKTTDSRMDIILVNAWPISYEGPDLFAQDSETTYETLTLVYEGIELVHQ